tara:strand:- start:120 stop:1193 length:1074 start_codon:yes stop_codon:yes gene_type:complete
MLVSNYLDKFNYYNNTGFKEPFFRHIKDLNSYHLDKCYSFRNFNNVNFSKNINYECLEDIPFLPIEAFKNYNLISCKEESIFKVLLSSGTSGQNPSKIFLDKENARNQSLALSKIFTDFTNLNRPNILIIDSPELIKNREKFNARVAGIIGFSSLCRHSAYALNSDYTINVNLIKQFLEKSKNASILIFGFTSIIWEYFLTNELSKEIKSKLSEKAILLHGGGWKKLKDKAVSRTHFNDKVRTLTGISKILNYYGMVEQTGSIFIECQKGFLHTNPLCGVISRSIENLKVQPNGKEGIAQVISALPSSYPGHSLLTDDIINIQYSDNCPCGRPGDAFKVLGRIKTSEIRGCSDTFNK